MNNKEALRQRIQTLRNEYSQAIRSYEQAMINYAEAVGAILCRGKWLTDAQEEGHENWHQAAYDADEAVRKIAFSAWCGASERMMEARIAFICACGEAQRIHLQPTIRAPLNLIDGILHCNECGQPMSRSNVGVEHTVGYISPDGHNHDDNCTCMTYTCPRGHRLTISIRKRCSTDGCKWTGKKYCDCHDGPKLEAWPKNPEKP